MKTDGKTTEELVAMQTAIMNDPDSRNPNGGIRIYTVAQRASPARWRKDTAA